MLAKNVNDNACILDERGVCECFASKLAPTVESNPLATV
ncbi:GGDEF domain protein [Pseudomonas orientalis]|nr:GGDEF domain protein [Pseudomonas orientalis]AZE95083.1 GGDEF domain protein [Pseudomonas orientalis]AZF00608.1 GGDEF domain protein [Pseudomonas orientalis]